MATPDDDFDNVLAIVLRIGVAVSAAVVILGGVIFLSTHAWDMPEYVAFRGEPDNFRSLSGIFHEAVALDGLGLVQFGVLLLIATPITRVLCSVVGFARHRDWMYVGITLIVLAFLTYSITTG